MDDSSLSRIIGIIIQTIDPDSIILFGSRASGNYRAESDYDICVLKAGIKERRKAAKLLYRALYGVGSSVDILVETPASFETNKRIHILCTETSPGLEKLSIKNQRSVEDLIIHPRIFYFGPFS